MKALVTGANGMLGKDLCPIFENAGMSVIRTGKETLDVTDFKATESFITNTKPEIILHLAAYTNVDGAEKEPEKADLINHTGTENLARAAKKAGSTLIYISSDYVFDGKKTSPYLPNDPANPLSQYGKSKFLGEEAVKQYTEKYYTVRTSWLYGIYGKNFIETMLSLAAKGVELKVVNDQTGSPTHTVDLALGILNLLNKPYGTYHISGEGETTWYDFAKEIFETEGIKANLAPTSTKDYIKAQNKTIAKRPKYSTLQNSIPMKHWKDALKSYLEKRKSLTKPSGETL